MPRFLFALALVLFTTPALAGRPALSPQALEEVRRSPHAPLILDVRTEEEFRAGHVPGAKLIPHDQLEARLAELGSPEWVVVYCRSGRRSTIAEKLLNERGFEVRQLQGSWLAWEAAGLPRE